MKRWLTVVFIFSGVLTDPGSPGAAETVLTFFSVADATIKRDAPTRNFGSEKELKADNSPVEQFLVKFSVSGVGVGAVTSAKLRLYNVESSKRGGDVRRADPNWSEATVTWNTAPAVAPTILGSLEAVPSSRWYEVDLAGHVTGDGFWSFRVSTTSSDRVKYRSTEGGTATRPQLIVVAGSESGTPGPLTASAGPDQAGGEGATFQFTGSATGGTSPYTFAWTFGDGTAGSGASLPHVYKDNGSFTVTLTVTDAMGQTASDTAAVTVVNVAPTANPGGPYSAVVGSPIAFSGSATDPSAVDTAAGFTFAWDFGDGVAGSGPLAGHTYTIPGTYTVEDLRLSAAQAERGKQSRIGCSLLLQQKEPLVAIGYETDGEPPAFPLHHQRLPGGRHVGSRPEPPLLGGQPTVNRIGEPRAPEGGGAEIVGQPPAGASRDPADASIRFENDHASGQGLLAPLKQADCPGERGHRCRVAIRLNEVVPQHVQHGPIALGEVRAAPAVQSDSDDTRGALW